MEAFKPLLAKVATGSSLSRAEAETAFDDMLSGEVTPAQMGAFLMALRVRGETVDEITGAVAAMRRKMLVVKAPAEAIDIVGTGGDGSGSYNVSTLASLIVAACGVPDYRRRITRVTARMPTPEEAGLLQQARTRPILASEAINTDAAGQPVDYTLCTYAAGRVQIVVEGGA